MSVGVKDRVGLVHDSLAASRHLPAHGMYTIKQLRNILILHIYTIYAIHYYITQITLHILHIKYYLIMYSIVIHNILHYT